MISDIEGVWSLGGREMSRSIWDGICVCVVGVFCIGALEVDCAGVVDILVMGGVFIVEV